MNYRHLYAGLAKNAAALLTPEAEQAYMQPPPQDPAMAQGAQMGGAPMGAAPMDPAAAGGMPMDPSQMGQPAPQDMQLPPEIMQDQMFMQFLQQAVGVMFDPQSGMFFDPQGQPVPPEIIMQAYQMYLQQAQQMPQGDQMGGAPMGAAPMDPAAAGGMPMDAAAAGGMPPEAVPMEQPAVPEEPQTPMDANELASVVMNGVESVLQEYTTSLDKRLSAILDKVEALSKVVDSMQNTTDLTKKSEDEDQADQLLRDEIAADLRPTAKQASAAPAASFKPVNLFSVICKK